MNAPLRRFDSEPTARPRASGVGAHAKRAVHPMRQHRGAALLSAIAGYVDAAGFLSLSGLFTAHVTGNLVASVGLMAGPARAGLGARLAMIPAFMLSVAGTALLARAIRRRGRSPLRALLALLAAGLAAFAVAGGLVGSGGRLLGSWAVPILGGLGVSAMAVQNTLMRDVLKHWCPTTLMTGNLTAFTIDLVQVVWPASEADGLRGSRHEARSRLAGHGLPLAGFLVGASLGGFLTNLVGLWSIAVPMALAATLALGMSERFD